MSSPPPKQGSSLTVWLMLVPLAVLSIVAVVVINKSKEDVHVSDEKLSAFNLAEAPKADARRTGYQSSFEREAVKRKYVAGPGLAGFVPEKDKMFRESSQGKRKKGPSAKQLARERAMIKKYGKLWHAQERKVNAIGRKYGKKYPIVHVVDKYFAGIPALQNLAKRYHKDRNTYQFYRDAIAIPEVRKGVRKFATNPQVLKVAVLMIAEALSDPPPKALFNEAMRTVTEDKVISEFMSDEVWPPVMQRLPQTMANTRLSSEMAQSMTNMAQGLAAPGVKLPKMDMEKYQRDFQSKR